MKISLNWLQELVDYQLNPDDLANQLSLISIGVKQQTQDYIELDLTYNRGDLLSLRGVAYEISAITDAPLKFLSTKPEDFVWVGKNLSKTRVEIESESINSFQAVAKIEGLKMSSSDKKWVEKLNQSGIRSVNNIVDITNLIMIEHGQPLHAFDAKSVKDETIIVRKAKKGESIKTLDGRLREFDNEDIVLADTKKPLDVAGVMGGKDSEVNEKTTSILLSASIFNPVMVRKTCKKLGLYSEASKRFQHGLSKMKLLQSLDAAIRLFEEIGGKLTTINFVGDFNQPSKKILISLERLRKVIGINLIEQTIYECLKKLNFTYKKIAEDKIEVIPPYFRMDINIEEDVFEEIARIYGYEKIKTIPLSKEKVIKIDQSLQKKIINLKRSCKKQGLSEVQTYSFFSSKTILNLELSKNLDKLITIANPISEETKYLKTDLWPNILEVVNRNLRKGIKDIAIFELAKVYKIKEGQLPDEPYKLCIALCNGTDNPLQELYQILQTLCVNLKGCKLNSEHFTTSISDFFHPNRFLNIEKDRSDIGFASEIHLKLLDKYGIEKRVALMEIVLE